MRNKLMTTVLAAMASLFFVSGVAVLSGGR